MGSFGRWEESLRRLLLIFTAAQAAGLWLAFYEGWLRPFASRPGSVGLEPHVYTNISWGIVVIAGLMLSVAIAKPCGMTFLMAGAFYAMSVLIMFSPDAGNPLQARWFLTATLAIPLGLILSRLDTEPQESELAPATLDDLF